MPGYVIALVEVHDMDEYRQYLAGFMDAFEPFNGRVIVATDKAEVLEGQWPQVRTVVMEFPSPEIARKWYHSGAYQELARHRLLSARTDMILVESYRREVK